MKNQKGFWFQNLEMTTILNGAYVEKTIQRIAYSVSALLKQNSILAVMKTDNVDLLLMPEIIELMLKTTVVSGGFGRRAAFRTTAQRTSVRMGRSVFVATVPLMVFTVLFGPLYG